MMRLLLLALAVAIVGTTAVAAEPMFNKPKVKKPMPQPTAPVGPGVDPVWAQQVQKGTAPVKFEMPSLDFSKLAAVRRQTLLEKAAMMMTTPEALTAPVRLSARSPYINDDAHLMFLANGGAMEVLPRLDAVQMRRLPQIVGSDPHVLVAFRVDAGRRYHFECEVYGANAEGPQTISITDNNNTSSVNTNQNATLVFVLDPQRSDVVYLKMFGERAWSMRGCDITSAPR